MPNIPADNPRELRELAAWYRDFAERSTAPWVSEGRLQTAEELEHRAALLEAAASVAAQRPHPHAATGADR